MRLYSLAAVEQLINHYTAHEGEVTTIKEGTLGYGTTVLSAPGKKYAIITERYLNEWSSAHTIRMYVHLPKKYLQAVSN